MSATAETVAFQAETKELLNLVIHSLYTNREIFLRELISNASDALDKLRVEALTHAEMKIDEGDLRIRIVPDADARTLRIIDNGIGMNREELIENIGTIAKSGTKAFLEAMEEAKEKKTSLPELIGQFGVGFYSSFIVADRVEIETRRAGESQGVRWSSEGKGDYTIEEIERPDSGTVITLHLQEPSEDDENDQDFTSEWVLKSVVKRYSDFIGYPVQMETGDGDERKWETLNSQKPLWTRSKEDIEEAEYHEFYRHVSHDWNEPLETIHFRAEGTIEYSALLYLPKERPFDLFDPNQAKSSVNLYVKRVFIMAECEELMPVWLRFVRGVVDSADLPLNISRETLQHNRQMGQMRKRLTTKVLDTLGTLLADRREEYAGFWSNFGSVMKEGIYYDDDRREEIAKLALFASTAGDEPCTLGEYVERMPVKQTEIYALFAPNLETARRSPHLETFRDHDAEVLFLTDPVDEFVLQRLTEFEGKKIRAIDKGEVDLADDEAKEARAEAEKDLQPLLDAVRKQLADHVETVRFSTRLTDSPACLVSGENDPSPHLQRLMRESGRDMPAAKRTLELNASHPLVTRMQELAQDDADFARFTDYCELLHGQALLAEGATPTDPIRFTKLVTNLMVGS